MIPVTPEATVVIPTRNRWPLLSHAVRGALGQEDVLVEVVVVDDGSTDETPRRLDDLKDDRLRVLRNERCLGVAATRNRGIAAARGEWVAFLDDDDLWSPRKLRAQLDAALAEDRSWAYAAGVLLDQSRRVVRHLPAPSPGVLELELLKANVMPGGSSNVVVRRALLDLVGGFDEELSQLADWDLWLRLSLTERPAALHETLVAYLGHSANMLVAQVGGLLRELEYLDAKHRAARAARGVELDRVRFVHFIAFGHRRAGRRWTAARIYFQGALTHRSPGSLLRAGGALAGERAMAIGSRLSGHGAPPVPLWLEIYR